MFRKICALFLIALVITGCGKLPRPFGRDEGNSNPLADNIFLDGVSVPPVAGTTRPMGELLSGAVAKSLEKSYEIPAAVSGLDRSRFLLAGQVIYNQPGTGVRTDISVYWTLTERDKDLVGDFVQDIDVTAVEWEYGSPQVIELIGNDASERAARMILGNRLDGTNRDRLLGRKGVFLPEVTGAPGDGNVALRRAMSVALAGAGVPIATANEKAAFNLQGSVELGDPENGAQAVRILWQVFDFDGKPLGRADQANAVPAGSLDGRWGQTAAFVAAAALDGILNIISEHQSDEFRAPDLGGGPSRPKASPPSQNLPQIPGRAPPPPN